MENIPNRRRVKQLHGEAMRFENVAMATYGGRVFLSPQLDSVVLKVKLSPVKRHNVGSSPTRIAKCPYSLIEE